MSAETVSREAAAALWYVSRRQRESETAGKAEASTSSAFRVGIQGEPGSFSHQAALQLMADCSVIPFALSADVFTALRDGQIDAAVIPIENSLAGSVLEHFDLLLNHDVFVEQETLLRIEHNLIVLDETSIGDVDRVFSHPVALAQCRNFLAAHPQMEAFSFYDTAGSVKRLVELQDRHAAAIASEAAAAYYGAKILEANIEDNQENFTRFFLVRRRKDARKRLDSNKVSLAFSVENRPGTLVAALADLSAIGTNLTKIESRPVHGKPWEYIFYVDCQIKSVDEADRALKALEPHCAMVKELGRYPEAAR